MICSKTFSIEVAEDTSPCGVLFGDTVWGAPVISTTPGGSASGSASGASANGTASSDGGDEGVFGEIDIEGTVSYTGPEMECCVLINSDSQTGTAGYNTNVWYDLGGPSETLLLGIPSPVDAASYPFTIPETLVATLITIEFGVVASSGEDPFPGGQSSLSITLGAC